MIIYRPTIEYTYCKRKSPKFHQKKYLEGMWNNHTSEDAEVEVNYLIELLKETDYGNLRILKYTISEIEKNDSFINQELHFKGTLEKDRFLYKGKLIEHFQKDFQIDKGYEDDDFCDNEEHILVIGETNTIDINDILAKVKKLKVKISFDDSNTNWIEGLDSRHIDEMSIYKNKRNNSIMVTGNIEFQCFCEEDDRVNLYHPVIINGFQELDLYRLLFPSLIECPKHRVISIEIEQL